MNILFENKKGIEISFAWIFAIIVGFFILFLAIYGVVTISNRGSDVTSAKTSSEINILLSPLETGFEEGIVNYLLLPLDTIIHNRCSDVGDFGKQRISLSQKTMGRWGETDINVEFPNKYIFSERNIEGKGFFIFSKPFNFPFKIADVIYITSSKDNYCFVDPPERIKQEIQRLDQENLYVEDCPAINIKVCFDSGNCDILVKDEFVEKQEKRFYYQTDSLMYAAIFSDFDIYSCQVNRLIKRMKILSRLYEEKRFFLRMERQINTIDLSSLGFCYNDFELQDLVNKCSNVLDLQQQNKYSDCPIW